MGDSWVGSRSDWVEMADALVQAGLATLSADGTQLELGGSVSDNGARSDALEGVARLLQVYAFAVASGSSRLGDAERDAFVRALTEGTRPREGGSAWPGPGDPGNATVNLAVLSIALRLLGPAFWGLLDPDAQARLIDRIDTHVFVTTPENNWVLFRLANRSFLASIGRSTAAHDEACARALEQVDAWYDPESGWYSDGSTASYDYYNAFELHYLPPLIGWLDDWSPDQQEKYRERLDQFLISFPRLFAADGTPVYFGRSLIYRFAVAVPFALSAVVGGRMDPAEAGERATAILRHFVDHGAVADGLLHLGWHGPQSGLAQSYAAPGASYMAGKAFVALLLPPWHPFWSSAAAPPPRSGPEVVGGVTGLLIDPAEDPSLVRIVNHGTNERRYVVQHRFDDPLYSRLGYSTLTAPVEADGQRILDRSFVVVGKGEPSSRGPIVPVARGRDWASSVSHPRRRSAADGSPDAPYVVRGRDLRRIVTHHLTVARRGWQLDICLIPPPLPTIEQLTAGGWAVPDGQFVEASDGRHPRVVVRSAALESEIVGLHGVESAGCVESTTPQPFGQSAALPYLRTTTPRVEQGRIVLAVATRLDRPGTTRRSPPQVCVRLSRLIAWRAVIVRFGWRFAVVRITEEGLRLSG